MQIKGSKPSESKQANFLADVTDIKKKTRMIIELDTAVHKKLKRIALAQDTSMNAIIRDFVEKLEEVE